MSRSPLGASVFLKGIRRRYKSRDVLSRARKGATVPTSPSVIGDMDFTDDALIGLEVVVRPAPERAAPKTPSRRDVPSETAEKAPT